MSRAEVLEKIRHEVSAAWSGENLWLQVELEQFLRQIDQRFSDEIPLLYAEDLFLAFACLHAGTKGRHQAQLRFELVFLSRIPAYLSRLNLPPSFTDDVRSRLREKLLAPAEGNAPQLENYSGEGPLAAWLRVVTVREAGKMRKAWEREHDKAVSDSLRGANPHPDDLLTREEIARLMKLALEMALELLPKDKRSLQIECLRRYFVDDQDIKAIGLALKIHYSTVFRWIENYLDVAYGELSRLAREAGLSASEPDKMARLVRSQLDLSLPRILKGTTTKAR